MRLLNNDHFQLLLARCPSKNVRIGYILKSLPQVPGRHNLLLAGRPPADIPLLLTPEISLQAGETLLVENIQHNQWIGTIDNDQLEDTTDF